MSKVEVNERVPKERNKSSLIGDLDYFILDLPQKLISKSNFRLGSDYKKWEKYAKFERELALEVKLSLPKNWFLGDKEKSISLRPGVISVIYAVSMTDTANFSKSILDACEDIVYYNDASVIYTSSIGKRSSKEERLILAFAQVDPEAKIQDVVDIAYCLENKILEIL